MGMEREGLAVSHQEMINRAKYGDVQAFSWIVEQYTGYLYAVIFPIVRDENTAEDILQETFWQIHRAFHQYSGGSFKSWAARIAVNKALDHRRRVSRVSEDLVAEVSGGDTGDLACPSAEDEISRRLGLSRLAGAVRNLPDVYRETFIRYHIEEKSYSEIALAEGISVKTVESRLYRARKLLRKELQAGSRGRSQ